MERVLQCIISLIIYASGYKIIQLTDREFAAAAAHKKAATVASVLYLFLSACVNASGSGKEAILAGFFVGALTLAAYSDYCTKEIYDFVYFPAVMGGTGLMLISQGVSGETLMELVIFILLQVFLFRRLYGISDCIAFSVCALYMAAYGKQMLEYLILMAVTFGILAVVQLCRRNINRKGNLKEPVALIPYISVAMLFF